MPHPGPKGRCSVNIPQLILSIVDVAAAIFLIAVVLLQSGKSAGLSGAIAGVADTFSTIYFSYKDQRTAL